VAREDLVGPGQIGGRAADPGVGLAERLLVELERPGLAGHRLGGLGQVGDLAAVGRGTFAGQQAEHGDLEAVAGARLAHHRGDVRPPRGLDGERGERAQTAALAVDEHETDVAGRRHHGLHFYAALVPPGSRRRSSP
jgi:hypothetical protein